jgi:amino acid adenylation domain-containing protein
MTGETAGGDARAAVGQLSDAERVRLARLLRERARDRAAHRPRRDPSQPVAASQAQRQLWLADQIGQGGSRYNIPYAVKVTGDIRPDLLEQALTEIRRRHEVLRTTFRLDGDSLVCDVSPDARLPLKIRDLSGTGERDRLSAALQQAATSSAVPFSLGDGPVMRAELYLLAPDEALVVLVIHHIATDAWSAGILMSELAAAYAGALAGTGSQLPEPALQYADAIAAQQQTPGQADEDLAYWRRQLADAPEPARLPADAGQDAPARKGARIQVTLPGRGDPDPVGRAAASSGTSDTAVLLAAYAAVLARCAGSDDIVIGTSAANRATVAAESLIGYFANTVPLRLRAPGHLTLAGLARQAQRVLRDATAHQGLPFARIVAECGGARPAADTPFFRVMFVHQTRPVAELSVPGLQLEPVEIHNGTAKFDLDLSVTQRGEATVLSLEYDAGLFLPGTAQRFLAMITAVLGQIAAAPDRRLCEADLVPAAERRAITQAWNRTGAGFPGVCLHELFEERASSAPGRVAVITGDSRHTFGEVESRANRVAHWLRRHEVRPNARVGICARRSLDMVVGLLGIAKAGGAYLPLDSCYPPDRLAFMIQDAGISALIGHQAALARVPAPPVPVLRLDADAGALAAEPAERPPPAATPASLAYAIYTSGSTGRPKGILADHRGRVSNFSDFNRRFGIGPGDSVLALSSLSFDMCAYDVFGMLGAGGTVVLPSEDGLREPGHWADLVTRHRVTVWHSVPALAELLADHAERHPGGALPLRVVLLGGDWIPVSLPQRLRRVAPGVTVAALGGATEVSMDSTIHVVTESDGTADAIPYGRPMANQLAYVIDGQGNLQPVGVPGELALGGIGVTWGYHGRPALTAEKFIPNPYSGTAGDRMYRTGDLARWRPDGELVLLGRRDRQVKLRGFRVELGEVETALAGLAGVRQAAVVAPALPGGGRRLAAFVVPARDHGPGLAGELAAQLGQSLPGYMVPASIHVLDALPLTPNGKLDRTALTELASQPRPGGCTAPGSPRERKLARLVAELLGLDKVGADDNFFELGGDSVRAIQLAARAADHDLAIDVTDIFDCQTVALLAERAGTRRAGTPGAAAAGGAGRQAGGEPGAGGPAAMAGDPAAMAATLSPFQRHMLAECELGGPDGLFVIQSATPLPGSVDPAALAAAWWQLQARHDALRLELHRVPGGWEPRFRSRPASALVVHDWRDRPAEAQARGARALAERERSRIRPGHPLLQLHLLQLSAELAVLLDLHHYLLFDGWSSAILNAELIAAYGAELGGPPAALAAPVSCRRYLSWLSGQDLGEPVRYWQLRLAGLPRRTWLSKGTGRCREPYRKHLVPVPGPLLADLAATARSERTTSGSLLLAAWSVLLSAATGADDVTFGIVSSGRPASLADVESIVGQLVGVLPLRIAVDGSLTLSELAGRVRQTRLDDAGHELASPAAARDAAFGGGPPLFDHLLVFDNYPASHGPETLTAAPLPPAFDLNLNQMETTLRVDLALGHEGVLAFSFDPASYPAAAISALSGAFLAAADQMARSPRDRVGQLRERLAASFAGSGYPLSQSTKEHTS